MTEDFRRECPRGHGLARVHKARKRGETSNRARVPGGICVGDKVGDTSRLGMRDSDESLE